MNNPVTATPAGNRWAVVLSNRAVKELRKLERDKGALEIIHKKIKELSLGQFTFDNHRNLQGTAQHIPLFRARVLPNINVRIIYQIDVLPDPAGSFDHQVIKIFGIIPRAQVDYNFWVKASARLVRVNPVYKLRCIYRLPAGANDKYRPVMFPHEEYGLGISNHETGYLLDDLNTAEIDAIQEITMERFAPLNKSLYNSVAADLDMAFPMVLDEHERRIVSHSGASIVIGRSGTGKTTALIYKMRAIDQANTTQGSQQSARQLFVTRSRVLAQHVEATYQGLVEFTNIALKSLDELKAIANQSREDPDRALVEFDSEIDLRNDLPERFSDLQDSNFPLFISFDKLCSLLEGDIRHILPNQIGSLTSRTLIGFDDFVQTYWPSFRGLSQSLEPNLVYSEIIGVIKGSQAALDSKEGYLTRREYVDALSRRQFPLLAPVRDRVYSIFEIYTKNKTARRETDPADRQVKLLTRLILRHIHQTIGEYRVDYLYIDEVQDNLMADIHLLRSLAKNAENIYWSGDSAQTVVAGSAFRINDLKAFTYRDQAGASTTHTPRKSAAQFTTFELNVNFRSLSGIVRFAGYVVQAIHGLFPESLDPMEPEKAKHFGDPPVLFTDVRNETGYFEKFLLGSSASNRVVFGAQQAILVRDAAAAEQLDSRLQGLCNILPVMDSKGLEFDDVLLYNFFSQSPAPASAWDHLLGNVRGNQAPPPVLCSELKLLYVAMTRARRRCWIWDSGEVISRLKTLWIAQDIIKVELASQMIGRLATTSSQAEWITKGREYFTHRLYKLAAACFRQAGRPSDARLSTAYHVMTRTKLKRLRGDSPIIRKELAAAASELEDCAETLALSHRTNVYYHAATCFESAREWVRASSAFFRAGRHNHGVQILFDARDFSHGAKALIDNRQHLEPKNFEMFREQARVYFLSRHEYRPLGPLFDTVDEKVDYVRQRDYKVQLKRILEQHQRFDELAEEHLRENDLDRCVQCYVEGYQYHHTTSSIVGAVEIALNYIESVLLIEGVYRKSSHDLARSLVSRVQPYAGQADPESCRAIDLFYAHLVFNHVNLDLLKAFDSGSPGPRQPRQILACYLAMKNDSWLRDDSVDVVIEHLAVWDTFIDDILGMAKGANPSGSKSAQRLLGFSPEPSTNKSSNLAVSENSLIQQHVDKSVDDDSFEITPRFINTVLREELPKLLHRLLDSLHTAALASPWVLPRQYSTSPLSSTSHRHPPDTIITSIQHSAPKLRVLCSILSVLDKSGSVLLKGFSDHTIVSQSWLLKMFGIIFSTVGEILSFSVLNTMAEPTLIAKSLSSWLRRDQNQLRKVVASDISITHALVHTLVRSAIYHDFLEGLGVELVPLEPVQNSLFNLEIVRPLQEFLFGQSYNRFTTATNLLGHIINQTHRVDALAIIYFVEQLTRETIIHNNKSRHPRLHHLFMPFSWILPLARKYGINGNKAGIEHINSLLSHLEQLSLGLRFGPPGRWHIGGKNGSGPTVDLLNLRLCWCVALLINSMGEHDAKMSSAFQSLKRLADDDMPTNYRHRHFTSASLYHKFSNVSNQASAIRILCETFHHESLILVQQGVNSGTHPAALLPGVHLIFCKNSVDLIHKLERMARGEPSDSSDEELELDYRYEDHDDLDQFHPEDDKQCYAKSDQSEEEEDKEDNQSPCFCNICKRQKALERFSKG